MHNAHAHCDFTLPALTHAPRSMILFVAMEGEAAPIAKQLALGNPSAMIHGQPMMVREGVVAGAQLRLITPGRDQHTHTDRVGLVYAATTLAAALTIARADLVVNAGTAGGFESGGVAIGDLVIARTVSVHDARVALPGFDVLARGHTRLSPSDPSLRAMAQELSAHIGAVSSGSSLDSTSDERELFTREHIRAKDMELAALAMVARDWGVALAALKGITDLVDRSEPIHTSFLRNLARASEHVASAIGPFIETLAHTHVQHDAAHSA